ncbi:MAG: RHS repeat domain-containing protein, partial [Candidatus Margulisiibacteriota bacterium]
MKIDLNALKQYAIDSEKVLTFEEELGPEIMLAKEHLPNYFKDDSWDMLTTYDKTGRVTSVLKGNERVEHFDAYGRLTEITDPGWGEVVKYTYDDSGNLIDIDYEGTRIKTRETIA